MKRKIKFALELAQLLERHGVALCTNVESEEFSSVKFMRKGENFYFTNRSHVTAYDLRCQAGMSSKQANEMYQVLKSLKEGDK